MDIMILIIKQQVQKQIQTILHIKIKVKTEKIRIKMKEIKKMKPSISPPNIIQSLKPSLHSPVVNKNQFQMKKSIKKKKRKKKKICLIAL
jgi:hypothetical protein